MMEFKQKQEILRAFGIPALIDAIKDQETELAGLEKELLDRTADSYGYIGNRSGDCEVVRELEAELFLKAPEFSVDGKRTTVDERKAWLISQRSQDPGLKEAKEKQRGVDFLLEDCQNRAEQSKRSLNRMMALLRVREAQIRFLASEV